MEDSGAYFVVSDVHLGSKECNHEEFCNFLEWIHSPANQSKTIKHKGKEIKIQNPFKIILLGDILELWDPEKGDRDNVITKSMRPFSLLSNICCDKIYVIGNHDDSLSELDTKIESENMENKTKFDIHNKHYPNKDEESGIAGGIKIGNRSYFFLHGQQFDKEQAILKYVSDLIGESWNPLGWFQILYNIPFTKNHWKMNSFIFLGLFLGGEYFLLNLFRQTSFWDFSLWAMIIGFFALIIWSAITGYFAISSIPGIVAHYQGIVYKNSNPKDKTVEQIITDKYYQGSKDTIDADVVVFGHTHFASSFEHNTKTGKKLFLNSGSWVKEDKEIDGKMRYSNTFIYIDELGAYILTWRGSGKIECIEAFI